MQISFKHQNVEYRCSVAEAKSLAIVLDFEGLQPNHFGTEKASNEVLKLGGFTGDTRVGGSCNVDSLEMIPHCNGTHTETVGHIVNEDIWVGHAALDVLSLAFLVTVEPVLAKDTADTYRPKLEPENWVITREMLEKAIGKVGMIQDVKPAALIVRTLPNSNDKCARAYSTESQPPFFTVEACQLINETGVRHLLVDFPSVDRMNDDGLLTNHHIFWNVEERTHELSAGTWQEKTITEMIFVADEINNGICGLNLQVPAFGSDAAPSRPVVFPARAVS
ncbi:MAG: cyclase family protein [Mariniblastus sp.]|nr:cyclase family protein [Mariniblastus sp.]